MLRKFSFLTLALSLVSCGRGNEITANPAECADAPSGKITAVNSWLRTTAAAGATSAAYFTICNQIDKDVSLVAVETSFANSTVHQTTRNDDGVASMSPRERIPISAGGALTLQPGGLHVMLTGLSEPIAEGDTFTLIVKFDDGSEIDVEAKAKALLSNPHDDH